MMLCCMDGFVLSWLEGKELGSLVSSFDGTGDEVGGSCVGLEVGGFMTGSEIVVTAANASSPVSCRVST